MKIHEIILRNTDEGWEVEVHGKDRLVGVALSVEVDGETVESNWYKPFVTNLPATDPEIVLEVVRELMK